jgi:CTP synthase
MTRYIFIYGGVISGLGKGVLSASIAKLLELHNFKVGFLKLDGYLNLDAGTLNPLEHGEVNVLEDGHECDLDLGHYYRFTSHAKITRGCSVTMGQILDTVLKEERVGKFLGKTIQFQPHVCDEIQNRISLASENLDILIIEVGGTVGDSEQQLFLRAIARFSKTHMCINIHLGYLIFLKSTQEWKTKPTQNSIEMLSQTGNKTDLLICRTEHVCESEILDKISYLCDISRDCVFQEPDLTTTIYELPIVLHQAHIDDKILKLLLLDEKFNDSEYDNWKTLVKNVNISNFSITIGIVGKYTNNKDSYKSIVEALTHAAAKLKVKLNVDFISAENVSDSLNLAHCDGILVPGGFGERGWNGMLETVQICRENHKCFLGICLGMQAMCVEFARNVCHLPFADSTEMNPHTGYPIFSLLEGQSEQKGGTMRLGSFDCVLQPGTKLSKLYQKDIPHTSVISETHRHRYEMVANLPGLIISGKNLELDLIEAVEIDNHPFMIGVQFHPEFRSKLDQCHPVFEGFLNAVVNSRL